MSLIALATAATPPADMDHATLRAGDSPLVAALASRGCTVEQRPWGVGDWARYDLVCIRSTWDYVGQRDRFVEWAQSVDAVTQLCNPATVVEWNTHKRYLIELEDRGAPIVPTAWLAQGDIVPVGRLCALRGWTDIVMKPAVDAGSRQLARFNVCDDAAAQENLDRLLATDDVLIQPFLPEVAQKGELSVIVIDGQVSHAVRKRPAPGDFRVQHTYGGGHSAEPITSDIADLAQWVVESTGHDLLYARVDLLEDDTGSLFLIELEATEPDLFLSTVPEGAQRIADAIVRRLE